MEESNLAKYNREEQNIIYDSQYDYDNFLNTGEPGQFKILYTSENFLTFYFIECKHIMQCLEIKSNTNEGLIDKLFKIIVENNLNTKNCILPEEKQTSKNIFISLKNLCKNNNCKLSSNPNTSHKPSSNYNNSMVSHKETGNQTLLKNF